MLDLESQDGEQEELCFFFDHESREGLDPFEFEGEFGEPKFSTEARVAGPETEKCFRMVHGDLGQVKT